MGTLHKYVTKKPAKNDYAIFLNELEKGVYKFDKEDLAEDGNDNSLHIAFKNSSLNSKLVDAFINGSMINPKNYSVILKHHGEKGLTPISSLFIRNKFYAKTLLRKLIKNKDMFQAVSTSQNGHKNILHHIIEHGSPSIINEYLIELFNKEHDEIRNNIINHKDKDGNTPLHITAIKGKHFVARTLLRLGANCKIENNAQQTPVKIAELHKHAITANILYRYGPADSNAPPTLPKNQIFMNKVLKNKNKKIKNIVFCGGGVKGIAYLGAVQALETKQKLLDEVENVAGTSAGAITAFLLALGYNSAEIEKFLFGNGSSIKRFIAFNRFKSMRFHGFSGGLVFLDWIKAVLTKRLLEIYNLSKLLNDITIKKEFEQFFADVFTENDFLHIVKLDEANKNFNVSDYKKYSNEIKNINFTRFHELVKLCNKARKMDINFPHLRDFSCIATCLSIQQNQDVTFSWDSEGFNGNVNKIALVDAVRASMAFPAAFSPHTIRIDGKYHVFSDGGIVNNYPIKIFDHLNEAHNDTLGFLLVDPDEILSHEESLVKTKSSPLNIPATLFNIARAKKSKLSALDLSRTIFISNMDVGTLEFNMKEHKRKLLINSGKLSTLEYLAELYKTDNVKPTLTKTEIKITEKQHINRNRSYSI